MRLTEKFMGRLRSRPGLTQRRGGRNVRLISRLFKLFKTFKSFKTKDGKKRELYASSVSQR